MDWSGLDAGLPAFVRQLVFVVPDGRPGLEWVAEIDSYDPASVAPGPRDARRTGERVTVGPGAARPAFRLTNRAVVAMKALVRQRFGHFTAELAQGASRPRHARAVAGSLLAVS